MVTIKEWTAVRAGSGITIHGIDEAGQVTKVVKVARVNWNNILGAVVAVTKDGKKYALDITKAPLPQGILIWDEPATFTVTGRGAFPTDMLRHDHCWPANAVDAAKLMRQPESGKWSVELTAVRLRDVTFKRWESFGGPVDQVDDLFTVTMGGGK